VQAVDFRAGQNFGEAQQGKEPIPDRESSPENRWPSRKFRLGLRCWTVRLSGGSSSERREGSRSIDFAEEPPEDH
jgi:hypothetical protein